MKLNNYLSKVFCLATLAATTSCDPSPYQPTAADKRIDLEIRMGAKVDSVDTKARTAAIDSLLKDPNAPFAIAATKPLTKSLIKQIQKSATSAGFQMHIVGSRINFTPTMFDGSTQYGLTDGMKESINQGKISLVQLCTSNIQGELYLIEATKKEGCVIYSVVPHDSLEVLEKLKKLEKSRSQTTNRL